MKEINVVCTVGHSRLPTFSKNLKIRLKTFGSWSDRRALANNGGDESADFVIPIRKDIPRAANVGWRLFPRTIQPFCRATAFPFRFTRAVEYAE